MSGSSKTRDGLKQSKTTIYIRIDSDVLAWLRSKKAKYSAVINQILRERMMSERKKQRKA
jgi:uncharacterized protein (DUF4415 family)